MKFTGQGNSGIDTRSSVSVYFRVQQHDSQHHTSAEEDRHEYWIAIHSVYIICIPYKAVVKSILNALGNMRISSDSRCTFKKWGEKGNVTFPSSCRHALYQVVIIRALASLVLLLSSVSENDEWRTVRGKMAAQAGQGLGTGGTKGRRWKGETDLTR